MDLKVVNNIDNNIFSTSVSIDAFGNEQMSEDEEKNLIENFPVKLSYRSLKFTKNIKIEGSVPVITDEEADGESIRTITLPPLSNKEIPVNEAFNAYYKIDYTKIAPVYVDEKVLTSKALVAQAYCLVFANVICDAIKEIMESIRIKAPAFEGETIVSV